MTTLYLLTIAQATLPMLTSPERRTCLYDRQSATAIYV